MTSIRMSLAHTRRLGNKTTAYLENAEAVSGIGIAHVDAAVESTRPQQCVVQEGCSIGGTHNQHLPPQPPSVMTPIDKIN